VLRGNPKNAKPNVRELVAEKFKAIDQHIKTLTALKEQFS
jgi:hypothetical protein